MIRRIFDLIFALFWLILLAPVILVIAILIKLDSPGPILYAPHMVGQHGQSFRLFRFRTMSMDKPSHLSANEKLTHVGRFIRNYSLDHLPTLVNLLNGDLTIIGPRPMETEVVDFQDPIWQRYFQAKPGLINYAVLKLGKMWTPTRTSSPGLNQELELEYLQKQSPMFDLRLFWQSMRAFILSKGNVKARGEPDSAIRDRLNSD